MMSSCEPRPNFVAECFIVRNLSGEKTSFVMVEGETDRAALEQFAAGKCALFPSRGKDNVLYALNSDGFIDVPGIAGIIDLDYTLLTNGYDDSSPNLLFDDCYPDLEMILLNSPALEKAVLRYCPEIDCERNIVFADTLKLHAHRLAAEFGYFRLLNHLKDCGLRCNAIRFDEVIDSATLELDCKLVASKLTGDNPGITGENLLQQVDELRKQYPADNPQLCRGKDVIAVITFILPILFQREFGDESSTVAAASTQAKALSNDLRMAYEYGYFLQTSLYSRIRNWESSNCPYKILKS